MSSPATLTVISVNGFMGNMWLGPQAEVAKHLSDVGLAYWQPVGYNSSQFPLSFGVRDGLAEFRRQWDLHPGNKMITAWSEGACIATEFLRTATPQQLADLKGGAFYGNPYRAEGQWNPSGTALGAVPNPGGAGVGGPEKNFRTPDSIHHYAHGPNQPSYDGLPGVDEYTCCSVGIDGDIARIFYNFVFTQWTGAFNEIIAVAEDFAKDAGTTFLYALKTAIQWIEFFGGQCVPHTNYTSHAGAAYLQNVAQTLP
jgi:hypothetical protein